MMDFKRIWLAVKVVLWKNVIIRKRHWFLTICEAVLPISMFFMVAYGRSKISGLNKKEITDVTFNSKMSILYTSGLNLEETHLFFSPSTPFYSDIIHRVQEKFQILNNNIKGFSSEDLLDEEYAKNHNNSLVAIIFNDKEESKFDYTVRYHEAFFSWHTEKLYENQYSFVPGVGSQYLWKGFLALQKSLDFAFIEKISGREQEKGVDINVLEFPYPPYKDDSGLSSLFILYLPLITLFSFIFVCPAVLKRVVEEKYSGIKELMKMVGMKMWMLWLGWFIYSIFPMIISLSLIVALMKTDLFGVSYPLIEYASGTVLYMFLFLYCAAATVFCFFLSTFFSKPTLATLVGLLIWILSYFIPKYLIEANNELLPLSYNLIIMLLPNMALHYGFTAISYYEQREIGVQWNNYHTSGGGGTNEVTMLHVHVVLVVDIILYMLLTFYFDALNPGKYGNRKSVFFPLIYLYKFLKKSDNKTSVAESARLEVLENGLGLEKGIELINLNKVYNGKAVVNNLSLDIYQDQITVLLGHNGAGKSTTMGMITGMIRKSGGTIKMNGKEVTSSTEVTNSIGLCPQHNLFFPDLTVKEHLQFFAMLKGKSCKTSDVEINDLLKKLNMEKRQSSMVHTLSGGMKRKLCLGMAVVGGSKILILDEPSSGMDPESRRHLWDLLLGWRNEKTILITTHFMEEADALGDWIAIMDEGRLRCYGTPMFLKKQYETGYNLVLLIKKELDVEDTAKKLEKEISKFVKNCKRKNINGYEVSFLLPFKNNYIQMFENLENKKDDLGIENISFTATTLEDVFLKNIHKAESNEEDNSDVTSVNSESDKQYCCLQLQALLLKRFWFIQKKYLNFIVPVCVAVLFLYLCIFLGQGIDQNTSSGGPSLKLALKSYGKTTVFFNCTNDNSTNTIKDFYKELVNVEKSDFHDVSDVSEAIIEIGIKNLPYYRHHMVAGAEIIKNGTSLEATALYNNLATHAAPISLNLITNALAKVILGKEFSISMTNHPLDNINADTLALQLSEVQVGLLWLIILPIGILFFLGSFIYFPFMELSTKFTQIQFMCGVKPCIYWSVTFILDLFGFTMFAVLMALINLCWYPFNGLSEFGAFIQILFFYGMCGIPYAYLFARKQSFPGAYAFFIIVGIMMGVLWTLIVMVLEESGDDYYINIGGNLKRIFLVISPQFGFTYTGVKFSRKAIKNYNFDHMPKVMRLSKCNNYPNPCCLGNGSACDKYKSYQPLIDDVIPYMLVGAAIFLLINILFHNYTLRKWVNKERNRFYKYINLLKSLRQQSQTNVALTAVRVKRGDSQSNLIGETNDSEDKYATLKVKRLKKSFSGKDVVNDVHFNLKKGECLGILGVNGAGKTTTFRMLTREEIKDDGVIMANNVNINDGKYLEKLGYCPQTDALNYSLTGRDILTTVAMLRGIKDKSVVTNFLTLFDLIDVADIPCEQYSGGNKRKLSIAVAIIGFPDFVLLDEPTNGVDPFTRRKFWTLLKNIRKQKNTSFILTSHSMAECEALCSDLKIMKNGTIQKQGTISKLKDEIGGYSIKIKLKPVGSDVVDGTFEKHGDNIESNQKGPSTEIVNVDDLKKYLCAKYKKGEVKDEHLGLLHFYIKEKEKMWSKLFEDFELLKMYHPRLIEDFSISEASLEDVFLNVARDDEETTN